jgi:hypothetical protein
MRITEFATQLFIKFAPVSPETVSNLNVQLSNHYSQILSSMETKNQHNADLTKKAEASKKIIDSLPKGSPERDEEIFRFTELQDQFQKPTFMERAVSYLDKPLVRVGLLVSFAFVARYLAKKLTQPVAPKEEEEELEQPQYPNFKQQPQYGYPPQFYPPQYGAYYPPNQQYAQGKH